ncbi:transposase [Pseudooceanicola spongiae]|uniref:transposase n=1 Tax=Pseudooceanicola spongiae TaxID=2613965 RepID=UPI001D0336A0|nr:transposase [Pseudooceanicola spongiae]
MIAIIQGETTVAAAGRSFDLTPSEIESRVGDAKRGMELEADRGCSAAAQAPRMSPLANPFYIHAHYDKPLKNLQEAYGEAMLELRARQKLQTLMVRP